MIMRLACALALFIAVPAFAAAPIYVAPSGGEDGPNIQAAMNAGGAAGAIAVCGTYQVGIDLTLVRNVAVQGCGPNACTIVATKPSGILFGFNFSPGMQLSPGFFSVSGCTLNLQGIAAAAFSIWSFGDYHDPGQTIYGIRLKDLQILGAKSVAVQIGRSMGTTLEDVYIQGGNDAVYCFDCGELYVSDVRAENGTGLAFFLWGTGQPDDHWSEGAHFDKIIANGMGYGLLIRNYGWITATNLDLTTTKTASALTLQGTVANAYITASDFSGNNGFGGLTPQPGIWFDTGLPQPLGPFQRITIAHSQVSNSSIGVFVNGVKITLDDVNFTANVGTDVIFADAHDSALLNSRADSAPAPNVVEQPTSTGNAFLNNVVAHGLSLQPGTLQRDNRAPTR